jgi:hypothetical protein
MKQIEAHKVEVRLWVGHVQRDGSKVDSIRHGKREIMLDYAHVRRSNHGRAFLKLPISIHPDELNGVETTRTLRRSVSQAMNSA